MVQNMAPTMPGAAAGEQRIMQGIVDELSELLGERLYVTIFDNFGRGMEI
jgi:hypothetical protein